VGEGSRIGHQRKLNSMSTSFNRLKILTSVFLMIVGGFSYSAGQKQVTQVTPVEIFQVYELPIAVTSVELVRTGRGYGLRWWITNQSNEKLLGFRYSLVAVDSDNNRHALANRSEAFTLTSYQTRRATIRTPLDIKLRSEFRLVIMLEQIVGAESIWEVVKSKDALEAYLSGDYSTVPRVLRVANQVDAPDLVPLQLRRPF
jgi:hypothetical protein